ncbi:hypothetical protein [Nioella sp.]|uniref:hypothetical protein n=1 Tax=Nioella sp. TaxID=1912091 RepID=UPI003B51E14E
MANWYTADLHFGHERIIAFCNRPHGSLAEMNAALIANFQACVGQEDDQWPGSRNSINVGVDQWDFRPVQLADIRRRAARLDLNKHWSDVESGSVLD